MPKTSDIQPSKSLSILLVGDSGTKKSRFIGSCPKPYIFDFDKGMTSLRDIPDVEYDTFKDAAKGQPANEKEGIYPWGTAWSKFIIKLNEIGKTMDAGTCPYLTLGLDSITTLAELALNFTLRNNNRDTPTLADWGGQIRLLQTVMTSVTAWPIFKVVVAHVQRSENTVTGITEKLPLVTGKFAGLLPVYFDEVWFSQPKAGVPNEFVIQSISTPDTRQAKTRIGVPDKTLLSYAAVEPFITGKAKNNGGK